MVKCVVFLLLSMLICISAGYSQKTEYIYRWEDDVIISDAERSEGILYRIELARVEWVAAEDPEFRRLHKIGTTYIESIDNRNLKAVLLGDFSTVEKATKAAKQCKALGFLDAKIIRYRDGLRESYIRP